MRTNLVCLALMVAGAAVVLCGCGACSADCAPAMPSVTENAAVVKVVSDPPCIANVTLTDTGVQISVLPNVTSVSGDLSCQIYEWLSDGTERIAFASFQAGSGPCCSYTYANGTLSSFAPVDGGSF